MRSCPSHSIPLLTLTFALLLLAPKASMMPKWFPHPSCPWVGAVQALFSFNSRTRVHVQVEHGCAGCGHARSCALSDTVPYHGTFKAVIFGSQIFFINKWGQKLIKSIHLKQRAVPGAAFQRISCGTARPFEMLTTTERLVFPSKANGNTRRTKTNIVWGLEHFRQPK